MEILSYEYQEALRPRLLWPRQVNLSQVISTLGAISTQPGAISTWLNMLKHHHVSIKLELGGGEAMLATCFCRKVAHAKTKQQQNMALLLWSCAFKAKYNVGTLFCYCEAVPSKQNTMLEHGLAAVKLCIESKNQVSTNMLLQCNNNLYIKRIQLHKYVLGWFCCTTKKSLHQTTCVSGVFETKRVSEKDSVGRCAFFFPSCGVVLTHIGFVLFGHPKGWIPKEILMAIQPVEKHIETITKKTADDWVVSFWHWS